VERFHWALPPKNHEYQEEVIAGNQLLEFLPTKVIFTHKRTSVGCGEA
jgi:hypothetical protein